MQQKKEQRGQIMGTLFTMLLFLVFVMCALFTVLAGGKVYENIGRRMADNYTGSVALQYIANKVRQGDEAGMVRVMDVEGTSVLELSQDFDGERYISWIYYYDGSIRELFTHKDSGLGLPDGIGILECEGLSFEQDGRLLTIETAGNGGGRLLLSLRSTGGTE
ncbi:MAG: DUF4860 domain-containing protein [Lachnospiraceae bacterium]|nr:DUF4860 domain-containing protein [Lachnospiraceae bacterium]